MLKPIPNTPYVVLAADRNAEDFIKTGAIIERHIATIPEINLIRNRPGAVVVDAGAFIGRFAALFEGSGAHVIAFEPQPDAFAALVHNCPWAESRCVAVGNGNGYSTTDEKPDDFGTRALVDGDVPSVTIDSLGLDRLDLLKIDVEGWEPLVLEGAQETIARCRPIMLIEVYPAALHRAGFEMPDLYGKIHGYHVRTIVGDPNDGSGRWDILCVPLTVE